MKLIKVVAILSVLTSGAVGAGKATASTCQQISNTWPFSVSCTYRSSGHGTSMMGMKWVSAWLKAGTPGHDSATTMGLTSSGQGISGCKAVDTTIDENPVGDFSGCETATGGVHQNNYLQ